MEEDIKKEIVSEVKSNLEEFKSSLKERIKLPVLVTYCIILVLYNWDIIYYFIFEKNNPISKIDYIKQCFDNTNHHRYLIPFLLAIVSTFIFPVVQVFINYCFQFFKNQNKRLIERDEFETVRHEKRLLEEKLGNKELSGLKESLDTKDETISGLMNEVDDLKGQLERLRNFKSDEFKELEADFYLLKSFTSDVVYSNSYTNKVNENSILEYTDFMSNLKDKDQALCYQIFEILSENVKFTFNDFVEKLDVTKVYLKNSKLLDRLVELNMIEVIYNFIDENDIYTIQGTIRGNRISKIYNILNQ